MGKKAAFTGGGLSHVCVQSGLSTSATNFGQLPKRGSCFFLKQTLIQHKIPFEIVQDGSFYSDALNFFKHFNYLGK